MIGDVTLTRLVRGKEIVLNARRQGDDCLISVTGGDAPHIGAAALCADGEPAALTATGIVRANSPPSLPNVQRPNSAAASAPYAASTSTALPARKSFP